MNYFLCPFCNSNMAISEDTYSVRYPSFEQDVGFIWKNNDHVPVDSCIAIQFFKCPQCKNYSIFASEKGSYSKGLKMPLIPNSIAKQFPNYIPEAIRNDYQEAYAILNLSPKASATLARRCLQGMIRDFYKISKPTLSQEINEIKNLIPSSQWQAIDATRSIGNIGAHMEKDVNIIIEVDPNEAEQLLKLIELLIDKWYIARHDEEELYQSIVATSVSKESDKKSFSN